MDVVCPYCKTQYEVTKDEIGRMTKCDICHQSFQVRVAQNSAIPSVRAIITSDVDFTFARCFIWVAYILEILCCFIYTGYFVWQTGWTEESAWIIVLAVVGIIVGTFVFSLAMLLFEVVKHLREIRDKIR